jgi:pyridoxamine 5'-phosphate oxidase
VINPPTYHKKKGCGARVTIKGGMRFLGIDFGWQGKASGLAALEWTGVALHLIDLRLLVDTAQILNWVDAMARNDTTVAIDAPIVIPNAGGMRQADKLAHSKYGRYHAGAYPASRERAYWQRTTGLSDALLERGFQHGDTMTARAPGRYQIEVHPHAATVQLNALDRIVKYKRGTLAVRRAGLERVRSLLLERLPRLTPSLPIPDLPPIPATGPALKALEDQLDAIMCAYVAAHWWFWGPERNEVLGNANDGYIVVPKRQTPVLSLADLRENYTRAGLAESDVDPDPIVQFDRWFEQTRQAGLKEPNAMTLATATPEGSPSARIVLLKGIDAHGFAFYTNYESQKGRELTANPRAELVFYWAELERQVRIHGTVEKTPREESETYFHSRPRGSQLGALVSHQSRVIAGRSVLEQDLSQLEQTLKDQQVPMPEEWGGFRLRPESFEFWQGRPNRLHDRLRYTMEARGSWSLERLSP